MLPEPEATDCIACRAVGPPVPVYRYGELPSTNQAAWELLAAGVKPPFAAIARCQTAGRGQWGRSWQSEPGGLYLSAVAAWPNRAADGLLLTLAVAWGIATTLRDLKIPVQLKWPNDLILDGRKLGGILCQQRVRGQRASSVTVIGVGIDWANPVPPVAIALQPWLVQANKTSAIASLEQLLHLALRGIYRGCDLDWGQNPNSFLHSYQNLLTSVKQPVTIGGRTGLVCGVAPDGRLRVSFPDSSVEILQSPGAARLDYSCQDSASP